MSLGQNGFCLTNPMKYDIIKNERFTSGFGECVRFLGRSTQPTTYHAMLSKIFCSRIREQLKKGE